MQALTLGTFILAISVIFIAEGHLDAVAAADPEALHVGVFTGFTVLIAGSRNGLLLREIDSSIMGPGNDASGDRQADHKQYQPGKRR